VPPVSPAIADCELGFIGRAPINVAMAHLQHIDYIAGLQGLGVQVIALNLRRGLTRVRRPMLTMQKRNKLAILIERSLLNPGQPSTLVWPKCWSNLNACAPQLPDYAHAGASRYS